MAFEGAQQLIPGVKASASLTAKQYYAMKVSGDGTVTVCASATDKPCGVLQDAPASGAAAAVAFDGVTKWLAGGTVAAGDTVGTDSAGKAVAYVPGTDTTKYESGLCLVGGASGEYITVLLKVPGRSV